ADEDRVAALRQRAFARIPKRFRDTLLPTLRLRMVSWFEGRRADLASPPGYRPPALRPLSGPLAVAPETPGELFPPDSDGRTVKSGSVAGAHWPDPALWGPDTRTVLEWYAGFLERRLQPGEREALLEARRALQDALAIAPDQPHALFELGVVQWLLRDDDAV